MSEEHTDQATTNDQEAPANQAPYICLALFLLLVPLAILVTSVTCALMTAHPHAPMHTPHK